MPAQRKAKKSSATEFAQRTLSAREHRRSAAHQRMIEEYGDDRPTRAECNKRGMGYRGPTITKTDALRKPSCVKQPGLSAQRKRSPVRIVVREGTLAPWKAILPEDERHAALLQAIERAQRKFDLSEHDAAIKIVRKINALYVYRKNNRSPKVVRTCNKLLDDEEWVREEFGLAPLDRKARQCPKPSKAQ